MKRSKGKGRGRIVKKNGKDEEGKEREGWGRMRKEREGNDEE
jgi:hypothetical protein